MKKILFIILFFCITNALTAYDTYTAGGWTDSNSFCFINANWTDTDSFEFLDYKTYTAGGWTDTDSFEFVNQNNFFSFSTLSELNKHLSLNFNKSEKTFCEFWRRIYLQTNDVFYISKVSNAEKLKKLLN